MTTIEIKIAKNGSKRYYVRDNNGNLRQTTIDKAAAGAHNSYEVTIINHAGTDYGKVFKGGCTFGEEFVCQSDWNYHFTFESPRAALSHIGCNTIVSEDFTKIVEDANIENADIEAANEYTEEELINGIESDKETIATHEDPVVVATANYNIALANLDLAKKEQRKADCAWDKLPYDVDEATNAAAVARCNAADKAVAEAEANVKAAEQELNNAYAEAAKIRDAQYEAARKAEREALGAELSDIIWEGAMTTAAAVDAAAEAEIELANAAAVAANDDEPEPAVEIVETANEETDYEKFLKASEYVITSPGRYLGTDKFGEDRFAVTWKTRCPLRKINKATARNILATFGLTPETYLAEKAKWVAAEIARGSRQFAINMQAEFLGDKIDADRKASVEPLPALVPAEDSDDDDELIDAPEVKATADDLTAKLAAFNAEIAQAEADRDAAKIAYENADTVAQNALAARQDFLGKTAGDLTQKLHEACTDNNFIQIATVRGALFRIGDFGNIYIDPTLNGKFKFVTYNNRELARYDTPAQVETVITLLKDAIDNSATEFHFPTVDELNAPPTEPVNADDYEICMQLDALDETTPEPSPDTFAAKICATVNSVAPDGWKVSFDCESRTYPVTFQEVVVTKLDSLALAKALSPEKFFDQFIPLINPNLNPNEQYRHELSRELNNLQSLRDQAGDDITLLKKIDEMIDNVQRELFTLEFNDEETPKPPPIEFDENGEIIPWF